MSANGPTKRILVIHMGGTIGMDEIDGALTPPQNDEAYQKAISPVVERFRRTRPDVEVDYECLTTVDSNDVTPEHMEELAAYIKARESEYDAVVITHGTDTYEKTAAFLPLAFTDMYSETASPQLLTPIVITGAQTSVHNIPQDATGNLFNSLLTAHKMCEGDKYYPRVVGVFGSRILDAPYIIKINESADDAMAAVDEHQGLLGNCSSSKGVMLNNTFMLSVQPIDAGSRRMRFEHRASTGDMAETNNTGRMMICPFRTEAYQGSELYVPIEEGGYVHTVNSSNLGDPRSLSPQAADPHCLAIIFSLTGVGNAFSGFLPAIQKAVSEGGVAIYGTLGIPGGHAATDAYAAGARFRDAGVGIGIDASPGFVEATAHALLARGPVSLTSRELMARLALGHHEVWLPEAMRSKKIPSVPEAYPEHGRPDKFNERYRDAKSVMHAYRAYKQGVGRLRFLSVSDPEVEARVMACLPRANSDFILDEHADLDWGKLTNWYGAPAFGQTPELTAGEPVSPGGGVS